MKLGFISIHENVLNVSVFDMHLGKTTNQTTISIILNKKQLKALTKSEIFTSVCTAGKCLSFKPL